MILGLIIETLVFALVIYLAFFQALPRIEHRTGTQCHLHNYKYKTCRRKNIPYNENTTNKE